MHGNISLTDENENVRKANEHLKEQANKLSVGLVKYMNMVLRMVQIMNQNGLAVEVKEIIGLYL